MKKIKIFLGSSITEFKDERNELELFIRNLSDKFEDNYNIKILPLRCENIDNCLKAEGTQNFINEELVCESDMCFFIFFTKVGEFTEEEFRVAFKKFTKDGKPKIYVYFKNVSDGVTVEESLKQFMNKIDNEFKHYHGTFDHIDTIKLRILLNLKIQEMGFVSVKVENGSVIVDGVDILNTNSISEYANSSTLKKLNDELTSIEEEFIQLQAICSEDNVESIYYKKYAEVASKRQNLIDSIEELENSIFNMSLKMSYDEVRGDISVRQKEAYRLFEQGEYKKCLAVLNSDEINNDFFLYEKKELERIRKRATIFIREHYTAISILEIMFEYEDRFNQITDRYNLIVPVIKKYMIELEVWLDFICYLFSKCEYEKCFEEIEQMIKSDYKSVCNNKEFCSRIKSILFGIVYHYFINSDKENLILFSEKLKELMDYDKSIIAPMLQIVYIEIGIRFDFFSDFLSDREEASAYFKKAIEIVDELRTEQTLDVAEKYNRYITNKYCFHTKDIKYPRFVHREGVSYRVEGSTLYIYGEGAMKDYLITYGSESDDEAPWSEIRGIKKVVIDEGVQYVGDYAFAYNDEIEDIIISSTVCNMGVSVFSGCNNLKSIYVKQSNKFYKSIDGVLYDYHCEKLIFVPNKLVDCSFEIPKSVAVVGRQAFSYNHNLKEIIIPNTVESIESGAFEKCDQLSNILLPDKIEIIPSYAFFHCESLEKINIPVFLKEVREAAFLGCGFDAFTIKGIENIKNHTFANCTKLKTIILGEDIKNISYYAFANCQELREIHFPNSLEYIDEKAFEWCQLEEIFFNGTKKEWDSKSFSRLFPENKYKIITMEKNCK